MLPRRVQEEAAVPQLKAHAIRLAQEHDIRVLLIEDQSSGSQLIQTLKSENPRGVPAAHSPAP